MTTKGIAFAADFNDLLMAEGIYDPATFSYTEVFDEVPIYSRLDQLDFLDGMSVAERNRLLVLAAVAHLDRITSYFASVVVSGEAPDPCIRLVSVTGWWIDHEGGGGECTDGTKEILRPHIWIGNVYAERMRTFKVRSGRSACAGFVESALDDARHAVYESPPDDDDERWCPTRVYVALRRQVPARLLV